MNHNAFNLVPVDPGFADANSDFSTADYAIFGVPFDATASHLSGAYMGPAGIREESYNFETYLMDLDVELKISTSAISGILDSRTKNPIRQIFLNPSGPLRNT